MPDDFEVGPTGLPLWRYSDWRALIVELWQAAYGPDADTRSETPDGLKIDILTLLETLAGEAAQGVYAGSFFRTAAGPQLDLLLDMFGRLRLPALPTTVTALWYGTASTVVWNGVGVAPVAAVASAGQSNGDRYVLTEAGTVSDYDDDGALVVFQILVGVASDDYGIEFDASESVITAATSDPEAIAVQLATEIETDNPTFTATAYGDGLTGALIVIQGKGTEVVTVGGSTTDTDNVALWGGVFLDHAAEETGPQQCLAETLTTVASGPALGVVNLADGALGRDVESNAAFRARHIDQINVGGKGTPQRIRAALLSELPDPLVEYARVDENTKGKVDDEGRPPHSFETTWIGTATAAQVAAVVFDQKPAGIEAFGDTVVEVVDEVGDTHDVGVTAGTELFLHLDIDVTAGEGFPTTGDIEGAISEAVVTALEARLGMGDDLYRVAVTAAIVDAIDGVAAVATDTATTLVDPGSPTFSSADVIVAPTEILRVDSTRITVTIL